MELSLITPVKHIKLTALLAGRFCVAPIAIRHKEYMWYFVKAAEAGYKVILDNGVFESNKVQDEDYIDLARQIKPRVLIAPDEINLGAGANYDATLKFIDLVTTEELDNSLKEPVELMHVIQCEKNGDAGFWKVLDCVMCNNDIQWIGICRDAVYNAFAQYTHTEDQELNRLYFTARLQEMHGPAEIVRKKWHFLGIGNRLELIRHYWFVDAMDTASFFYQSTLGNHVTKEFFMPGVLKRPRDYFIRDFGPEERWIEALEFNCLQALVVAQQADVRRRRILGGRL